MSAFIPSWAARAGVGVLVVLSIAVGFQYWQARHDEQLAWITVGAELIAFAGLAVARASWKSQRGWALIAIVLTLLAAGWSGLTMFQKISDDSRDHAVAQAEQTLAYQVAKGDLQTASEALRLALAAPRPADQGPLTITAWDAAQAASVARLTHARDDAIVRANAAMPPLSFDWIAVARGVGVEIIKLLGFAAFGIASEGFAGFLRQMRLGGIAGATVLAATPAYANQPPESQWGPRYMHDPIVRLPETGKKAKAFALRGRMKPDEIAVQVGVSRSTVYRWFKARDLLVVLPARAG